MKKVAAAIQFRRISAASADPGEAARRGFDENFPEDVDENIPVDLGENKSAGIGEKLTRRHLLPAGFLLNCYSVFLL